MTPNNLSKALLGVLLGWVLVMPLAAAEDVASNEAVTEESVPALDPATLREVERLRVGIERLLSTLPPSMHARVRALLLTEAQPEIVAALPVAAPPDAEASVTEVSVAQTSTTAMPGAVEPPSVVTESGVVGSVEGIASAGSHLSSPDSPADVAAPQASSPAAENAPPTRRRRVRRDPCNTLDALDENGDGKVSALDRHWRFLYVWIDRNQDGQRQDKEIESSYAAGVREIETGLDVFYRKKGSLGEIRLGKTLLLDLAGNGFGDSRRPDDGILMVDADGLGRGQGPKIVDSQGIRVSGIQPFVAGWRMQLVDGQDTTLSCPRSKTSK